MTAKHNAALRRYYQSGPKHTFDELGDGTVRVTDAQGRTGRFHWHGPWIEGELTQANMMMLMWCGGPALPPDLNFRWTEPPLDMGTKEKPWPWPKVNAPTKPG